MTLAEVTTEKKPDGKPGPHVNVVGYKLLRVPPYPGREPWWQRCLKPIAAGVALSVAAVVAANR